MSRISRLAVVAIAFFSVTSVSQASLVQYEAFLDGPSESPVNASPGTGYATVNYDNVAKTLALNVTFSGLIGTTTNSHIHGATAAPLAGTAGVATRTPTFLGFPSGVTAGAYNAVLDLTQTTSYNAAFVTANGGTAASAELALTNAIAAGKAYWNIHSSAFPGGEIRGFLVPVPEPASLSLLALGGLALVRRRR